ncbi:MAG TPA: DNA-formamidopyrimidine glycosylase family protein [Gemmatimonadaceae bacterium]|nr:DNA-formamidopyrimidine glycosylase family protein [Gemmatimonadaceae bacterium]
MPELPDITVYIEALNARILHQRLIALAVLNPFVLRTFDPPIAQASGREVVGVGRIGKRIVIGLEGELFIVIHLMIAGRLRWLPAGKAAPKKLSLATLAFETGTLVLTEAGTTRRASLSLIGGREALSQLDRGGLDVFASDFSAFATRLRSENHTLKRSLTDPRLFDAIGNAYSDEILHRARLSPVALSGRISDDDARRLYDATRVVLREWTDRLRAETGDKFPERVTAFRPEMAVHGKYRQPCPVCGTPVQRIRYASNETDYCARCQTNGKLLADRGLSRLLKQDWPRSVDEL